MRKNFVRRKLAFLHSEITFAIVSVVSLAPNVIDERATLVYRIYSSSPPGSFHSFS